MKGPGRDFGSPYKHCCRFNLTRQAALLIREVSRFKVGHVVEEWPCIVAGGMLKARFRVSIII